MNCQDARESLSLLLDGNLSLTERVPLELHVNTCGECRQKLADLQIVKIVEEQAAPRPVRDWRPRLGQWRPSFGRWRPSFGRWRLTLAHWWLVVTHWRPTLRRPTFGRWRPMPRHGRPTLGHWRPALRHWRPALSHWRPNLGHRWPTLGHWRPHVPHWRPTMAAGLVGRALGTVRTDDAASRLRRFVAERLEKFPPRQLAAAAAVPLVITLAIFIFERGFSVGTSMRQRPSSAPTAMRTSPPPDVSPEPIIPIPRPPAPALPVTPALTPPARTQPPSAPSDASRGWVTPIPRPVTPALPVRPAPGTTPAAHTQPPLAKAIPGPKASETSALQAQATVRNSQPESSVQKERAAVASSKPVPTRAVVAPPAEAVRKDIPKTSDKSADVAAAASRRGAVDVIGRLQVKSRSEAERDLAALLTRSGCTSVSRQRGAAVTIVQAAVPHASYGKFSQGLVRLGSWRIEAERSPLPDIVQVSVRLAD